MSKTVLLTDSACDLSPALEEQYHIDILPFHITVDGEGYTERQDFTCEEYYEMLGRCKEIPKTSQITSLRFLEQFLRYDNEGVDNVICVTINSAGSNTYNAARMARSQFAEERPDSRMHIYVIDSHTYSMTYGYPLVQAAKKLAGGADVKTVLEYLEGVFARTEIVLAMYTLRFAKKSGHISAAAAFAGELLGLRPIITLIDDKTKTVAKVRGDAAVMPALVQYAKEHMEPGAEYLVGGTDLENCKMLAKLCKKELGRAPVDLFLLGAAVATNTGPNAVAIVYPGAPRR